MHMDDSVNELMHLQVGPLPETAMGLLCICLVGALPNTHYVMRSPPLYGVKLLPPHRTKNDQTRPPAVVTTRKQNSTLVVHLTP